MARRKFKSTADVERLAPSNSRETRPENREAGRTDTKIGESERVNREAIATATSKDKRINCLQC